METVKTLQGHLLFLWQLFCNSKHNDERARIDKAAWATWVVYLPLYGALEDNNTLTESAIEAHTDIRSEWGF